MINFKCFSVVILLTLLFAVLQPSYADPPMPSPVGRVVWVKGTLTATMPNEEVRTLKKMSIIYLHDTLTTDDTSEAQVIFSDETLMTFHTGTKFFIDTYAYNPQAKSKSVGKYLMNLIEGGFRTITGLIAKSNPSDYQVNTPVATIGVRGTDYAVYIDKGELYVGYYGGKPCVTGRAKAGQTLCLDQNTPYANVPSANAAPVPLQQQPSVFQQKLSIVPATIAPFNNASLNPPNLLPTNGGTVSSFCIQ